MNKAEVYAKHMDARISPKKMAIVMNLVRGLSLEKAKVLLAFDTTKAAKILLKVVKSAEANAKNNHAKTVADMFVSEVFVTESTPFKRGRFASRARVDRILKRTSHIIVGLSEKKTVKAPEKEAEEKVEKVKKTIKAKTTKVASKKLVKKEKKK